jgi:hypothetical protein
MKLWRGTPHGISRDVCQSNRNCTGQPDDREMLRIYATENATQRGNSSTAVTGSIAAASNQIAKALIGDEEHFGTIIPMSSKAIETARGNL